MEISTGQSSEKQKAELEQEIAKVEVSQAKQDKGLIEQIQDIKDKNSKEYRDKIRELEIVLGVNRISIFGTANRSIFEENLANMSVIQIQDFARKLKVDPFGSVSSLKTRILRQFDAQNRHSTTYTVPPPASSDFLSDKQREDLQKILNNG